MKDKVNILGTEYTIRIQNKHTNPKLEDANGLCEMYSKEIVIDDFAEVREDKLSVNNFDEFINKVVRHEIIHAYFGESGLRCQSDFAQNEELVDWIAIQLPKIVKTCEELNVL